MTPEHRIDGTVNNAPNPVALSEKLRHRTSFAKATLSKPPSTRQASAEGMSKEHSEHGRVKPRVYRQYVDAASKVGFLFFLFTTISQQAASVFANLTLRAWGEHNQSTNDNSEILRYLIIYGLFSLSSTILGGISSIVIWVFCALRSARRLHDSVRLFSSYICIGF